MLSLSRRQVVSKQQQQCAMIPVCEESSAMMFLFMFCSTTRGGEDCRACLWTDGEWGTEQLLPPYPPLSIGADDSWLESVLSFACKPLCSRYSPICRITVQSMMHFTRRRKCYAMSSSSMPHLCTPVFSFVEQPARTGPLYLSKLVPPLQNGVIQVGQTQLNHLRRRV